MHNPALAPSSSLFIRNMQPDDVDMVSHLAGRIWRKHYPAIISRQQIEYMLDLMYSPQSLLGQMEKGHRFWLAYQGERLAGYIAVEDQGNNAYFIHKLYVDIELQGLGIGTALIDHAIAMLKPGEIALHVNRANIQAINFYFRHGFTIECLKLTEIGGGFVMDDFVMKRVTA